MTDPRALLDAYGAAIPALASLDPRETIAPKAFAALRAVLDQHPERKFDTWSACDSCTDGDHLVTWPCPTIEAIMTELEKA